MTRHRWGTYVGMYLLLAGFGLLKPPVARSQVPGSVPIRLLSNQCAQAQAWSEVIEQLHIELRTLGLFLQTEGATEVEMRVDCAEWPEQVAVHLVNEGVERRREDTIRPPRNLRRRVRSTALLIAEFLRHAYPVVRTQDAERIAMLAAALEEANRQNHAQVAALERRLSAQGEALATLQAELAQEAEAAPPDVDLAPPVPESPPVARWALVGSIRLRSYLGSNATSLGPSLAVTFQPHAMVRISLRGHVGWGAAFHPLGDVRMVSAGGSLSTLVGAGDIVWMGGGIALGGEWARAQGIPSDGGNGGRSLDGGTFDLAARFGMRTRLTSRLLLTVDASAGHAFGGLEALDVEGAGPSMRVVRMGGIFFDLGIGLGAVW